MTVNSIKNIVIIDDNVDYLNCMKQLFQKKKLKVLCFVSFYELLQFMSTNKIIVSIIILDYHNNIHQYSIHQINRYINQHAVFNNTKIIFMSADLHTYRNLKNNKYNCFYKFVSKNHLYKNLDLNI